MSDERDRIIAEDIEADRAIEEAKEHRLDPYADDPWPGQGWEDWM